MSHPHPYQPFLLRLLHSAAALLTTSALISGFWVYNTYDKRWGSLTLPKLEDIQGIHGTIALTFLLLLSAFALYSFHLGDRRLIQERSLSQLSQLGKPIWWVSIHRLATTLMLLAATFAVVTGRMMKEEWLPAGQINNPWYLAHLIAWAVMFTSLALHLLMAAKVGAVPLLLSMFHWTMRDEDRPHSWLQGITFHQSSSVLKILEVIVIGGIIAAFILPVLTHNPWVFDRLGMGNFP